VQAALPETRSDGADQGLPILFDCHPSDQARQRERNAADQAARAAVAPWREVLGEARFSEPVADLTRLTPRGPIRPAW
jgi:hypothetical protein